ncbi:MAG: NUDIX domain-containing protein [Acholeplasmataceae bacterium]|nr:NUDIX domain-containing protein [Acholeplasmataceae bacterium]
MKVIENFDSHNYEMCTATFHREAVRAIIKKENQFALIKGKRFGEYKFPGGGKEEGESNIETLIRETLEETGLTINPSSISPYGMAIEKRRSVLNPNDLFQMESYYYLCEAYDDIKEPKLDDYELLYGYELTFASIDEAIDANEKAAENHQHEAPWINRELAVFKDIKKAFNL